MEEEYLTNRDLELDEAMQIKKCIIDFSTFSEITNHVEYSKTEIGWGLLLGYFDSKTNQLNIKQTWQCEYKTQGKQIIDQSQKDLLLNSLESFEDQSYRQVGFYIFSDDLESFSTNLINFMINNPMMQAPNVFIHFNLQEANNGEPCIHVYTLNKEFNSICKGHRQEALVYYEQEEEKLKEFINQNKEIFTEVNFEFQEDNLDTFLTSVLDQQNQTLFQKQTTNNEKSIDQFCNALNNYLISKNNTKLGKQLTTDKQLEEYGNKRKLLNFIEMRN